METLVIDIGTGYTKIGFAGNFEPTETFPSSLHQRSFRTRNFGNFLDVELGTTSTSGIPEAERADILQHGQIRDWDVYERFLHHIYFERLRADPEEHFSMLTEPPMTAPEVRERLAELMFETFSVPGFYIGVQAVMALFASRLSKKTGRSLTGVVVDSGAGVTHVLPIVSGYVVSSCVKHLPLAGGDVTNFIAQLLRARREDVPGERLKKVAEEIKEQFSYNCPSVPAEFARFDAGGEPDRGFRVFEFDHRGTTHRVDVGYEQFLAPEILFNPGLVGSNFGHSLPQLVDQAVRQAPLTSRLELYNNVILSGGTTLFKDFDKRLQRDLNHILKNEHNNQKAKARVITHSKQKYAVWFGASILAKVPEFPSNVHTKAKYEEVGPRIARHNAVFFE